jgi:hypothetical protein
MRTDKSLPPEQADDIDRLFALSDKHISPPGSVFDETLRRLKQEKAAHKTTPFKRFALAGLGLVAALALGFIALVALFPGNNRNTTQTAFIAATAEPVTTAVITATGQATNQIATINVTPASAQTTTEAVAVTAVATGERTTIVSQNTQDAGTPKPDNTPPAVTSAAPLTTRPLQTPASTPEPLPSPVTAVVTTVPAARPVDVGGKVTAYDKGSGLITLSVSGGKTALVKITAQTQIFRKSQKASADFIKEGATLTASGLVNTQGQVEASVIVLDIQTNTQPIGDPRFPEEPPPDS